MEQAWLNARVAEGALLRSLQVCESLSSSSLARGRLPRQFYMSV
jgi:hypothetical protein